DRAPLRPGEGLGERRDAVVGDGALGVEEVERAELGERARGDGAGARRRPVEGLVVVEDERAVGHPAHVGLDEDGGEVECVLERGEGALGEARRRPAAVGADEDGGARPPAEVRREVVGVREVAVVDRRDGAVGGRRRGRRHLARRPAPGEEGEKEEPAPLGVSERENGGEEERESGGEATPSIRSLSPSHPFSRTAASAALALSWRSTPANPWSRRIPSCCAIPSRYKRSSGTAATSSAVAPSSASTRRPTRPRTVGDSRGTSA